MRWIWLTFVLFVGATAFGHGKEGVDLKGVVVKVTPELLTLAVGAKTLTEVQLPASLKVEVGAKKGSLDDVKAGARVVVHARKNKDGTLVADLVRVASSAAPDAGATPR